MIKSAQNLNSCQPRNYMKKIESIYPYKYFCIRAYDYLSLCSLLKLNGAATNIHHTIALELHNENSNKALNKKNTSHELTHRKLMFQTFRTFKEIINITTTYFEYRHFLLC